MYWRRISLCKQSENSTWHFHWLHIIQIHSLVFPLRWLVDMPLNIVRIYELCREKDQLLSFLQNCGLIKKVYCPRCEAEMKLYNDVSRLVFISFQ